MNIDVQTQGFSLTTAIEQHVRAQIQSQLDKLSDHVVSVDVFLRDINGPRGGLDKKVLMRTRLRSQPMLATEQTRSDLYDAIVAAARQTRRAVKRSVRKRKHLEKQAIRELNRMTVC
jgi:ribosome-associated translation inhibitor RaiA